MVIYPSQEKTRSSFLSLFTSAKFTCGNPWPVVTGQRDVVTVVGEFLPTLSTISKLLASVTAARSATLSPLKSPANTGKPFLRRFKTRGAGKSAGRVCAFLL